MTTYAQRIRELLSTGINVILFNGDADEMLSSRAYREQWSAMVGWLDWLLGAGHCKESYEWEREHYDVDRFKQ
jgi:hypothetical protein